MGLDLDVEIEIARGHTARTLGPLPAQPQCLARLDARRHGNFDRAPVRERDPPLAAERRLDKAEAQRLPCVADALFLMAFRAGIAAAEFPAAEDLGDDVVEGEAR